MMRLFVEKEHFTTERLPFKEEGEKSDFRFMRGR